MALLSFVTKLYVVVANLTATGSVGASAAAVAVVAALAAVVASTSSGRGPAVVINIHVLFLSLLKPDSVDVCLDVVL